MDSLGYNWHDSRADKTIASQSDSAELQQANLSLFVMTFLLANFALKVIINPFLGLEAKIV